MKLAVSVYCVYFDAQKAVLLVKDAHSLQWGFPGGRLEPDEMHDDALRRELTEETGLMLRGDSTYITRQDAADRQRYFYKIDSVEGLLNAKGNDDDILDAAYFDVTRLPSPMAPGVNEIITQQKALLR